ncbi:MAG: hypothetical protein V1835_07100 [Candidatus Micrarchaeota archaeon]
MDDLLLRKLGELQKWWRRHDIAKLKELGGDIAEIAYLRGDRKLVDLIIVSYALAKFLEKHYITGSKQWEKFYNWFGSQVENAIEEVKNGDQDAFYSVVGSMVTEIQSVSESAGRFQSNIVIKARIKAGTQIYAHGASLSTAAAFAQVDKSELASYINVTKLPDKYGTKTVGERMKMAREFFG